MILDLACSYCTFLFFSESWEYWILGLLFFILVITISLFLVSIWFVLKESRITRSYLIQSEKGTWTIEYEGNATKTRHLISKVNGKKISMAVPGMATLPQYKKPKNIKFEYVKILDDPPPFGNNYIFIAIDGSTLSQKDRDFIDKIKPIGTLSIVLNICFVVFLLFSFISEFEINLTTYLCLFLFFPFIRTVTFWVNNRKLRKCLKKK